MEPGRGQESGHVAVGVGAGADVGLCPLGGATGCRQNQAGGSSHGGGCQNFDQVSCVIAVGTGDEPEGLPGGFGHLPAVMQRSTTQEAEIPTEGPTPGRGTDTRGWHVTGGWLCPTSPLLVSLQGCSHRLGCPLRARRHLRLRAERCPGRAGADALRGHGHPPHIVPLRPVPAMSLPPYPPPQSHRSRRPPRTRLHRWIPSRFYLASPSSLYSG